jgi:hypothetical protein
MLTVPLPVTSGLTSTVYAVLAATDVVIEATAAPLTGGAVFQLTVPSDQPLLVVP